MKRLLRSLLCLPMWLLMALAACQQPKEEAPQASEPAPVTAVGDSAALAADSIARLTAEETALAMRGRAGELFSDFVFTYFSNHPMRMSRTIFPLPCMDGEAQERLSRSDFESVEAGFDCDTYIFIGRSRDDFSLDRDTSIQRVAAEYLDPVAGANHRYCFARGERGAWMLRAIERNTIDQHPDAAFLAFFHRFATDSAFCMEHTAPMISILTTDPDDEFQELDGTIERSQWPIFGPDMPQGAFVSLDYGQTFRAEDDRVVMIQEDASELLTILYFRRHDDAWRLYRFEN